MKGGERKGGEKERGKEEGTEEERRGGREGQQRRRREMVHIKVYTSFESGLRAYWMLHSPTTPRWRTVLIATERSRLYSEKQAKVRQGEKIMSKDRLPTCVGECLGGSHYDGLSSVDTQWINVLHVTHLDDENHIRTCISTDTAWPVTTLTTLLHIESFSSALNT